MADQQHLAAAEPVDEVDRGCRADQICCSHSKRSIFRRDLETGVELVREDVTGVGDNGVIARQNLKHHRQDGDTARAHVLLIVEERIAEADFDLGLARGLFEERRDVLHLDLVAAAVVDALNGHRSLLMLVRQHVELRRVDADQNHEQSQHEHVHERLDQEDDPPVLISDQGSLVVLGRQEQSHQSGEKHSKLEAGETDGLTDGEPFEGNPFFDVAGDDDAHETDRDANDELAKEE